MELKRTATTYNPMLCQGAPPSLSAQQLELAALATPLAKPACSYALALVAVKDVQEMKPVHVMARPGEHGDVFSIMILEALSAPTALHPLVITIQFKKLRESNNHF